MISCVVTEILTVQTGDKLQCTKLGIFDKFSESSHYILILIIYSYLLFTRTLYTYTSYTSYTLYTFILIII